MDQSKLEPFTPHWNPLIMRVLLNSVIEQDSLLFGITGDIDNLGIYVAKNGRAKAENLVDLFNQIIRNEFVRWARLQKDSLEDYAFVASGEEIVLIGICRERSDIENLFHEVNANMNRLLRENRYIDIGETGISFGCAILENANLKERISRLATVLNEMSGGDEFVHYLDIMEIIRETLASELDKIKFKSLTAGLTGSHIIYRNLVYAHLLNYKYETTRFLTAFSNRLSEGLEDDRYEALSESYGLNNRNRRVAMEIKEMIENLEKDNS